MTNSIVPMNGHCNLPAAFAGWNKYPQFIIYRRVWDDRENKWAKRPTSPHSGHTCNAHDRKQWLSYEAAYAACLRHKADGVGFVLCRDDPFWFADADHCLTSDGWSATARDVLTRLDGAAFEVSSGNDGIHVIGCGIAPEHSCKNVPLGLEFYTEARFVALTFNSIGGNVMCDLTPALAPLVDTYFKPNPNKRDWTSWTEEPVSEWCGPVDDDELIKRALASKGGADVILGTGVSFKQLWEADETALARKWPSETGKPWDGSSADSSLAARLAFWTGKDCARIERLMRQSGLVRDKWDDRPDWLADTIMGGCGLTTSVYASGNVSDRAAPMIIPPPPRPGHVNDDLGPTASVADKGNHLFIEMMVRSYSDSLQYDEFSDVVLLNGKPLTDNTERRLWLNICAVTSLKINKLFFGDVIRDMAYRNRFHPVREYIEAVQPQWDNVNRCETWLIRTVGAPDTPYIRAVSRIFAVAAVKRIREPGCKFDEILVLEGPQGYFKSSLIAAMSPEENWFSDTFQVGMSIKEAMETFKGRWIIEAPELSRMNVSEIEHVKTVLSRRTDRARPAYGRNSEDMPRHIVSAGTTNSEQYLRDPTGNRRFLPVKCTKPADVAWLEANRDQLWAEAALREMGGESIRLPEELWAEAAEEQMKRMVEDPYADVLADKLGGLTGQIDPAVVWALLAVPIERRHGAQSKMGDAMKRLGFEKRQLRDRGQRVTKYYRGSWDNEITLDTIAAANALGADAPDNVVPLKEAGK